MSIVPFCRSQNPLHFLLEWVFKSHLLLLIQIIDNTIQYTVMQSNACRANIFTIIIICKYVYSYNVYSNNGFCSSINLNNTYCLNLCASQIFYKVINVTLSYIKFKQIDLQTYCCSSLRLSAVKRFVFQYSYNQNYGY